MFLHWIAMASLTYEVFLVHENCAFDLVARNLLDLLQYFFLWSNL